MLLAVVACGPGGTPARSNVPEGVTTPERPGNAAVYERIEAETDCGALQDEFDTAEAGPPSDWKVPYMEAADARMQELDCY